MTRVWVQRGEQLAVVLITLGNPVHGSAIVLALLGYGFVMVLVGMVLFMIVSHV